MDSIFQHKWCHLLCNTFVSQKICKTYFLLWRNSFLSLIKVVLRFRPICHEWLHWEGDKILPPPSCIWIILVLISLFIPMTPNSTFLLSFDHVQRNLFWNWKIIHCQRGFFSSPATQNFHKKLRKTKNKISQSLVAGIPGSRSSISTILS